MTFITSQAQLTIDTAANAGVECVVDFSARTIQLRSEGELASPGTQATDNGVDMQTLHSAFKTYYAVTNPDVAMTTPFPFQPITPSEFFLVAGWEWADDATRRLVRNAGWQERAADDSIKRVYVNVRTGLPIVAGNTPYYFFAGIDVPTSFDFDGLVNQAVQTFGDASNGNFDYRLNELVISIRTFGNEYGRASSAQQGIVPGVNELGSGRLDLSLTEATDLVIASLVTTTVQDLFNDIVTTPVTPYNQMSITALASATTVSGLVPVAGDTPTAGDAQFGFVVNANTGAGGDVPTRQQIYAFVQAQLSRGVDIDAGAGTLIGQVSEPFFEFIGDILNTLPAANPAGGGTGVAIENFSAVDQNFLRLTDNDGDLRRFPSVAAGLLTFPPAAVSDANFRYALLYSSGFGDPATAVFVTDASGDPIRGALNGATSVAFDYAYDSNVDGGRTPGTDASVILVGIGSGTTGSALYNTASGTITNSTAIVIPFQTTTDLVART